MKNGIQDKRIQKRKKNVTMRIGREKRSVKNNNFWIRKRHNNNDNNGHFAKNR